MDAWLFQSWRQVWPSPWLDAVLALVSVVCGLLIGLERQRHEKPAGLRTFALVCLGAAVFTMASFAFTSTTGDSGRVAAQIVTGIGFLGAGVILHGRRVVSGMTTAATIWIAAAVGITAGIGYVPAALGLSVLVLLLLHGVFLYETRFISDLQEADVALEYSLHAGLTRVKLEHVLADFQVPLAGSTWSHSGESGSLRFRVRFSRMKLCEMLNELVSVPGVRSIVRDDRFPLPQ